MAKFWEQKMRTFFVRVDIDHDGKITKKDFEGMAERFKEVEKFDDDRGQELHKILEAVWEKCLSNLGGTDQKEMNETEFISCMSKAVHDPKLKETLETALFLFFLAVDSDDDCLIDSGEYEKFFETIGVDKNMAQASFKSIDANNDGLLSLDEFTDAGIEFFFGEDESKPTKYFWGPLV